LYLFGWNGINIDSNPDAVANFDRLRPSDLNIHAAITEIDGTVNLFQAPDLGEVNTLSAAHREKWQKKGVNYERLSVPARRLDSLLSEHVPPGTHIDYMNIDVEDAEMGVLRSNDWQRFRPALISIEIHGLDIMHPSQHEVARFLIEEGYMLTQYLQPTAIFTTENGSGRNRVFRNSITQEITARITAQKATNTPVFVHIGFNNIHTQSYLNVLKTINEGGNQYHITFIERTPSIPGFQIDVHEHPDVFLFDGGGQTDSLSRFIKNLGITDVFHHGIFFNWHKKLINQLADRVHHHWIVWGGDLYQPIRSGKASEPFIANIRTIVTPVRGDYDLFAKHYGPRPYIDTFEYSSNVRFSGAEASDVRQSPPLIIVGNSGDPSNHHAYILEILAAKTDIHEYRLYLPFAYNGSDGYLNQIRQKIRELGLDEITSIQTEFMKPDDFMKLVQSATMFIGAHDRQQAHGTIKASLYCGNITIIRETITIDQNLVENPSWQYFRDGGLKLLSLEHLIGLRALSEIPMPDMSTVTAHRRKLLALDNVAAIADKMALAFLSAQAFADQIREVEHV